MNTSIENRRLITGDSYDDVMIDCYKYNALVVEADMVQAGIDIKQDELKIMNNRINRHTGYELERKRYIFNMKTTELEIKQHMLRNASLTADIHKLITKLENLSKQYPCISVLTDISPRSIISIHDS